MIMSIIQGESFSTEKNAMRQAHFILKRREKNVEVEQRK